MASIQIDTESLTTSNCPSLQDISNGVFHTVILIDMHSRVLCKCNNQLITVELESFLFWLICEGIEMLEMHGCILRGHPVVMEP